MKWQARRHVSFLYGWFLLGALTWGLLFPAGLLAFKTPETSEGTKLDELSEALNSPAESSQPRADARDIPRLAASAAKNVEEALQVLAVDEELRAVDPALFAVAESKGKSHVVLAPEGPVKNLESLRMDLFFHETVRQEAERLRLVLESLGATVEHSFQIPRAALPANQSLEFATRLRREGRNVVVILDNRLRNGLQFPADHPAFLLVDVQRLKGAALDSDRLLPFFQEPDRLLNHLLDLTDGTIYRVSPFHGPKRLALLSSSDA